MNRVDTAAVAGSVLEKHFALVPPEKYRYPEVLSFHAFAKLALDRNDAALLDRCLALMKPLHTGKFTQTFGAYDFYRLGGSAFALLVAAGKLPEEKETLRKSIDEWLAAGPRCREGFLGSQNPNHPTTHVWIDMVFATCPYLTLGGLALDRPELLDEAVRQLELMRDFFRDPATGLYHQSLGKLGPDRLSDDFWSRGNGWGLFGLAESYRFLPETHPGRGEIGRILADHLTSCCDVQDGNGMLHQEMSREDSYVETSGTGLFLFALGVALETGLLPERFRENLLAGLRGYLAYIGLDGSVHNCCCGCLCPGDGSKEAYMQRPYSLNDPHGFGPAALAFGQAAKIGIAAIGG